MNDSGVRKICPHPRPPLPKGEGSLSLSLQGFSHDRYLSAGFRHPRRACRPIAGPDHRRGGDADLRHLDLRAVQSGRASGLRVFPQPESDPLRLRALRGRPGRRRRRFRLRLGLGRHLDGAGAAGQRRSPGGAGRHLRRHPPLVRTGPPPQRRLDLLLFRPARPGGAGSGADPANPDDLGGNAQQSAVEAGGFGDDRRRGPPARHSDRGRQHLRHALGATAAGIRFRYRDPFRDQVSERPFRHHRRGGGVPGHGIGRTAGLSAKRHRRDRRPLRQLSWPCAA